MQKWMERRTRNILAIDCCGGGRYGARANRNRLPETFRINDIELMAMHAVYVRISSVWRFTSVHIDNITPILLDESGEIGDQQ